MSIILNGLKGADLIIFNVLQDYPNASIRKISHLTTYAPCTVWRSIKNLQTTGLLNHQKTKEKKLC